MLRTEAAVLGRRGREVEMIYRLLTVFENEKRSFCAMYKIRNHEINFGC